MSKDKGSKNTKKKPAEKSGAKKKVSDYKSEGKNDSSVVKPAVPKSDPKKDSGSKK